MYSGTNDEDLGSVAPKLEMLSNFLRADIVSFDYCGWGLNQSRDPTEGSICECLEAVLKWVMSVKKVPLDRIILYVPARLRFLTVVQNGKRIWVRTYSRPSLQLVQETKKEVWTQS